MNITDEGKILAEAGKSVVSVVGLGSMGLGMARSLLGAGHEVHGIDVNEAALQAFVEAGGHRAPNFASAASVADIIVVVVVNAQQTESVLFGPEGLVASAKPGTVFVSCATLAPEKAKDFARRVEEAGGLYVDGPISGGSVRAANGELTFMASGSPEAFAAARPALDAMAARVYELGDKPGIGSSFKIVNQLLAGVHIAAACEAITFAKSLDLDISRVFEVITQSAGNSWMFENRVPHVLDGDYTPHSAVSIFTKDLGIVSDIGRDQKFPLSMTNMALQLFIMTEASGMGRDDDSSVARLLANIAGIELPGAEKKDN